MFSLRLKLFIKMILPFTCLMTFLMILSSCSSLEKVGTSMAGNLILEGMPENETEANWEHFSASSPANIKLIENLLYTNKEDKSLLFSLTKSYGAYALLVSETKLLESETLGTKAKDLSKNKKEAIYFYSKAIQYGLALMNQYHISYDDLIAKQNNTQELHDYLNAHFDSHSKVEMETVFFFAQSLGGLINLQKDRPSMIAHLPLVKGMFDWVCSKEENFYYGSCYIFYGMYETSRPTLLGGHPEKGKEFFLKGIKENPLNLFIKMSYIQYYLLPMDEKEEIKKLSKEIEDDLDLFDASMSWSPQRENKFNKEPHLNLFNATAQKRWQTLKN